MKRIAVWLFIALVVGGVLSLWASSDPDGFERAGEDLGYLEQVAAVAAGKAGRFGSPGE
ncbi:MAG: PDGLE domain-containing protein [Hydrogenibacillus sp.]|nr:PDGLE domain-containing protein [Hydrogenibacillus sp.]